MNSGNVQFGGIEFGGFAMSRKSKSRPEKVNVPSDLFGVYATLSRGLRGGDFRSNFIASSLYVDCMAGHLKMARMALDAPLSPERQEAARNCDFPQAEDPHGV